MPFQVGWYIEGQVIYAEIWGDQTMEELHDSNSAMIDRLENAGDRLIHVIMRDEKLESIPVSLPKLQSVLTYTKHPNLGWVTMIGNKEGLKDSVQNFLIIMLAKLTRARYIRFKTFEEALEHLQKVDQSINWDAVNPDLQVPSQR